jgi:hypothetical protein
MKGPEVSTFADIDALRREIRQITDDWHRAGKYTPRSDNWLRGYSLEFSAQLAAAKLIGISWPAQYGGRGLSAVHRLAAAEELLRAGAPVAAHWVGDRQIGPALLRHGTDQLKNDILPGVASSEYRFCLGMSEPTAGSDLASVSTHAVAVAGGFLVNGRKTWTSGAHHATHIYLLARTDRDVPKHQGLSEFIVDMDSPGIMVSPIPDLTGEHHFNEVLFEDVFVGSDRLLGTLNKGWGQVTEQLSFERGGPERYLSTYPLFAQLLDAAPPAAAAHIGALTAQLSTLRRLAFEVAAQMDLGQAPTQQSATLKYLGNAFEHQVIDVARTALTPSNHRPDSLFGHSLLASPGFTVRGGTAEVLLAMMAREEKKR